MCSFCSDEGSCLFCADCTSESSSPLGDPAQSFLESNSLFDKRAKKAGRRVSSWARESFRRSLLLPVSMRASHNGAFNHLIGLQMIGSSTPPLTFYIGESHRQSLVYP